MFIRTYLRPGPCNAGRCLDLDKVYNRNHVHRNPFFRSLDQQIDPDSVLIIIYIDYYYSVLIIIILGIASLYIFCT